MEILLVTRDDNGEPFDPPALLIDGKLMRGVEVPNGYEFIIEERDLALQVG